jgi:mRNA-degrading endonuclease RelE of RelBE toxin-antitoxin system
MYFLTEIQVSDFEAGALPALGRYRLASRCTDGLKRSSAEVFQAVSALAINDQRQAIKGLKQFAKLAQLGLPFNQLTDKKVVHEAFEPFYCEVTKRKETVWRYRHGDIRILFYYAADKVVLLAHTLPKRSDKLSEKDKNHARQAVVDFLMAAQSNAGLQWI